MKLTRKRKRAMVNVSKADRIESEDPRRFLVADHQIVGYLTPPD